MVPGYRGYRLREDLRNSDKMLRLELSKRLALQRTELEEFRQTLVTSNPMSKNLTVVGGIVNEYKKIEGLMHMVNLDIQEYGRTYHRRARTQSVVRI